MQMELSQGPMGEAWAVVRLVVLVSMDLEPQDTDGAWPRSRGTSVDGTMTCALVATDPGTAAL